MQLRLVLRFVKFKSLNLTINEVNRLIVKKWTLFCVFNNYSLLSACMKIALVDDHKMLLSILKKTLETKGKHQVSVFDQGQEFLKTLSTYKPDLLICDLQMPEMSGVELVAKLKSNMPDLKILVLSMVVDPVMIKKMYNMGVQGYVQKKHDVHILEEAIEAILEGRDYYDEDSRELLANDNLEQGIELTKREKDVLRLLAKEMSSEEIAEELNLSIHTVKTFRKSLMQKFGTNKTIGIVLKAMAQNLL